MAARQGGALISCLLLLFCAQLARTDDVIAGDYLVTTYPSIGSTTTVAQLAAYTNVTHILGGITIAAAFCTNTNFPNNSARYDALVSAFGNVREIHGFLSIQVLCFPDISFFRKLVVIRGYVPVPSTVNDVLSIAAGSVTVSQGTLLRQFGFWNLKLVNGGIRIANRANAFAIPGPGAAGLCGKGSTTLNLTGVDLTLLVPGTVVTVTGSAPTRNVTKMVSPTLNFSIFYLMDEANTSNVPYCGTSFCHPSCNGRCWGRNSTALCQQVCNCSSGAGCPDNNPNTCCPANCSSGCSATGVCNACAAGFVRNPDDTCQTTCPPGYLYFGYQVNRDNCRSYREFAPFTCLATCPTNYYRLNDTCVHSCPQAALPVNGVCPSNPPVLGTECKNVDYVASSCALTLLSNQTCDILLGSVQISKTSVTVADTGFFAGFRQLKYITGYLYAFQMQWLYFDALKNIRQIQGLQTFSSASISLFVSAAYIAPSLSLYNLRYLGGVAATVQDNRFMCLQRTIDWSQLFVNASTNIAISMNFTSAIATDVDAEDLQVLGAPALTTWGRFIEHPLICPPASCNPICGTRGCWDSSSYGCQRCPGTQYLVANNGSCVDVCPPGTYVGSLDAISYPDDTSACLPCHPTCATCNGGNETNCLSCRANWGVRLDGSCGFCDMSSDGFLLNTTCVQQCPVGMFKDTDTAACQPCSANCTACEGLATICTNCSTGLNLVSGMCVSVCPASTYAVPGVLQCQPCASECARCTGPSTNQCQACTAPLFFLLPNSTSCVPAASCPVGTYANQDEQECDVCGANCLRCVYSNHSSQCLNCTGATYLPADGICHPITNCSASQFIGIPATVNFDNICFNVRNCTPGSQYQTAAPTAVTDRVCTAATTCNSSSYISTPLTATTDRACSLCRTCPGTNESSAGLCNGIVDEVCIPRPLCTSSSCLNNGTCINHQGWYTTCECTWPFSGPVCDIDNRSCNTQPCLNGGSCTPVSGGFSCSCSAPFTGTRCAIDTSVCNPSPCQNNGTCTAFENRDFRCTCRQGYEGVYCNTATSDASSSSALSTGTAVAAGLGLLVLLVLLAFGLRYAARQRRKAQAAKARAAQPADPLLGDEWEIDRTRLIIGRVLGEGQFGQVNQGLFKQPNMPENTPAMDVAVKSVKDAASETDRRDFMAEIRLMKDIGRHPHVLSLVGVCSGEPQLLVVEYAELGDLRSYMIERRATATRGALLVADDMLDFCLQIAHGMEYLAQLKIIHRDLACRNVLVAKHAGALLLKVSDFGLARDIYEENFYKKTTAGKVPFKWMSPEALNDSMFTTMSDVWSFGVVMWEIYMLGMMPYPGVDPQQLVRLLARGFRMPCPPVCPDEVYEIMLACWDSLPEKRPTFTELRRKFANKLGVADVYENAHAGIAYYMTPGVMYSDTAYDQAGSKSLYDNEGGKSNYDNEGGKSLYDNEGQKSLYDNDGGRNDPDVEPNAYDNATQEPKRADDDGSHAYDNPLPGPGLGKAGGAAADSGARKGLARRVSQGHAEENPNLYDNPAPAPARRASAAVTEEEAPEHLYDMGVDVSARGGVARTGDASASLLRAGAAAAAVGSAAAQRGKLVPQRAFEDDDQHAYDNPVPQRNSGEHPVPKAIARGIVAAAATSTTAAAPPAPTVVVGGVALEDNAFYDSAQPEPDPGYIQDFQDSEEDPQLLVRVLSKRSRESFDLGLDRQVDGLVNPEYDAAK